MIEPRRAMVRPRVHSPITGEALLLEDFVSDAVRQSKRVSIQIVGGPGSGKTTALQHLRAVLAESIDADLAYLDEPASEEPVVALRPRSVVFTVREALTVNEDFLTLSLAPWGEDDVMEYLLAQHRPLCGTIMAGLRQGGGIWPLQGIPELLTLTLDSLAGHRANLPLLKALGVAFMERVTGADTVHAAGQYGLACVLADIDAAAKPRSVLGRADNGPELLRFLRHVPLQHALAVGRIAADLAAARPCLYLKARLPRHVVRAVAEQIRDEPAALAQVRRFLTLDDVGRHPMAASICHHLDPQWLRAFPRRSKSLAPTLTGAYLDHADWPGVDLHDGMLNDADLSFANLAGLSLQKAVAQRTNFHGAVLCSADLRELNGIGANFSQADLRKARAPSAELIQANFQRAVLDDATFHRARLNGADFTGAALVKTLFDEAILDGALVIDADLSQADFTAASLAGIDFRTSQVDGSRWCRAIMTGCNFEEVAARAVDFSGARLSGSLWTGSALTEANFAGADLRNTGLAEIDWERADLREADLRGASFHMGSSRSGLVGSPIAREGSMTGFYTDDYTEQDFKAPEEIRKANLRGADLRGAKVAGVDFYLVDLRDALYDDKQGAYFLASGAILRSRTEEAP